MSVSEILKLRPQAFALQNAFIKKFKQNWGLRESVIELTIQIGHLCQSLINNKKINVQVRARNQINRTINNIPDELCDCFLSVCSIYNYFNINESEHIEVCMDKKYSYDEVILDLFNLSSQLLDSCMIYLQVKPPFKRDERKEFLCIYFNIVYLLAFVSDMEHRDISKDFSQMIYSATQFLQSTGD